MLFEVRQTGLPRPCRILQVFGPPIIIPFLPSHIYHTVYAGTPSQSFSSRIPDTTTIEPCLAGSFVAPVCPGVANTIQISNRHSDHRVKPIGLTCLHKRYSVVGIPTESVSQETAGSTSPNYHKVEDSGNCRFELYHWEGIKVESVSIEIVIIMQQDLQLSSTFKCHVQVMMQQMQAEDYSKSLKEVFTVATIKQFWKYYQHMKRPNKLRKNDNIYFFKSNVKPQWEAEENQGCLQVKLIKPKSNRQWQDLLLCLISPDNKFINEMNGLRLKIKDKYDIVEIWLTKLNNHEQTKGQIQDYLRRAAFHQDDTPTFSYTKFEMEKAGD